MRRTDRTRLISLVATALVAAIVPVALADGAGEIDARAATVAIASPSSASPAVVADGGDIVVSFSTDLPGTWALSYSALGAPWARFPAATGAVAAGSHTVGVIAPLGPSIVDLRLDFTTGAGTTSAAESDAAVVVRGPTLTPAERCGGIDIAHCLLPFPNDRFTAADPTTDTGRRLNLSILSTPRNVVARPVDPTELNRNDGFSPGAMIMTRIPGLDLEATWGAPAVLDDLALSMADDAPMILLNADTGERHPFWAELDEHPATSDDDRLLIIRPARNLEEGARYIVAIRHVRSIFGGMITAQPAFAAYRAGTATDARVPHMERLFSELAAAGVDRGTLYLTWDFTVASERNLTERVLTIRDDAFAALGDVDLANGVIEGISPSFTVDEVVELDDRFAIRRIEGTIQVPNYMTPQVYTEIEMPEAIPPDVIDQISDAVPDPAGDLVDDTLPVAVPQSRFNTIGSPDGLPVRNPVQPTVDVPFTCLMPRSALDEPARPILYGHGLLGERGQVGGGTNEARQRGFAGCAVDWWGMSFADISNVALVLVDISNFPSFADRVQQGFLNVMYLARTFAHPQGFASHPAFRTADGRPMLRTGEVWYRGDSQGGIMGGAVVALSPDIRRAVLGVPGMNYSTLLNRSVDWEGSYGDIMYIAYTSPLERQLVFALLQGLWDRAETNGYAHHMTTDPLPNTPTHEVLLEVAFGDHQVANVTAEVIGRTIGATLRTPSLADGLHWSVDPAYGFPTVTASASPGTWLVYWFDPERGNLTPPSANLPATAGSDPHGSPRHDRAAGEMERHFLLTGELLDTCAGAPCLTTAESRIDP